MKRWVFEAHSYPPRKTLAQEPKPRKPLNPNCFILCVVRSCIVISLYPNTSAIIPKILNKKFATICVKKAGNILLLK